MYSPSPETIVLHRSDFLRLLDFALNNAPLRDYCVIRLPSKCGLRPGEARLLRWSQVDFDSLTLNVEDSKKHEQLPVPIDPLSCDFLRQLRMESTSEWVFTQSRRCSTWKQWSHMPLSYDMLDKIVKRCGRAAGCTSWRKMNMYLLRHFFAANWAYPGDGKVSGNLHALSKILRHKSLAYTQIYLSRLVFYEDIQQEYNRLQSGPFAGTQAGGSDFFARWCSTCAHEGVCRFMDQALTSSWAEGCHFFSPKTVKEEMQNRNERNAVSTD
jgi:integrase